MQRLTNAKAPQQERRRGLFGTVFGWFRGTQDEKAKKPTGKFTVHYRTSHSEAERPCYRYRAKARRARKAQKLARRVQRQNDPRFRQARAA